MEINGTSDIVYLDYPITKKLTNNGELKTYKDSDALAQAIKIWLSSEKGEKIRNRSGGILIPFLGKTMSDEKARDMEIQIRKSLREEFQPPIELVYLKVTPNYDKEQWIINLAGYNTQLSVGVNTNVILSNF